MKTIKETIFEFIQKELMTNETYKDGISTIMIAQQYQLQRSNVSALLNELVKEGKLEKTNTRPVLYTLKQKEDTVQEYGDKFLIGEQGSLAKPLQIAKAAILYPQHSLNVLVSAKSGCGTTRFVYAMYEYAKYSGVFQESSVFFKINCRHYKENTVEIESILFGCEKNTVKGLEDSYFGRTRGGMLFIDHADMLSPRQRSLIDIFLETGRIYTEDKKTYLDCKNVFLVMACHPSSVSQFAERIPMIIELPELKDRPLTEKLDLVHYFFTIEANNAQRNVEIRREVLEALLLTDFPHNIKNLEIEIKKACATAFVRCMDQSEANIEVTVSDFSVMVQRSLMHMRSQSNDISELIGQQNLFIYDCHQKYSLYSDMDKSRDLYTDMRTQYTELSRRGIKEDTIHDVINTHVDNLFKRYKYSQSFDDTYDIEQLSKIVDSHLIHMVQNLMKICKQELNRDFKSYVFYGLCLHMNSLLSHQFTSSRVNNEKVIQIVQDYPKEYGVSVQFAQSFEEVFGIVLSTEEVVIITMFLIEDVEENQGQPKLLYILHGKGVASSLKEVTNTLTHCNNAYAYDLLLEKDSATALEEIKALISKIDDGQGIIVIYDMGSIKTMLNTISEEMHVKIRYIYFPITLVGIEVARKCVQEKDLDYVYHTTLREMYSLFERSKNRKDIIVTLCHTGEGGALQLKQYIDQYSNLGFKTIPLSISNRDELVTELMELKKVYHIHCFVGSYDPKLLGIPFISMRKVFENKPEDIDKVLMFETVETTKSDYSAVYEYLESQLQHVSIEELKKTLPPIMDKLEIMYALNEDRKLGLFVHIACLLETCKQKVSRQDVEEADMVLEKYPEDFKEVYRLLRPLEKQFKVIFEDAQIATIVLIVKQL